MPLAINDRALKYFLSVVRTGSIRAAADVLNVAPSAISRQIAELEATCGSMLIERLPRGVVPTEAGKLMAEHAQRQADEVAMLADRLRQLRGLKQGTVHICCGAGFTDDLMENGLARFSAAHPGISYKVSLGTTDRIIGAVASGDADIGVAYNPIVHPEVRAVVTSRQPIAAIVPAGHPLAEHGREIGLSAFSGERAALLPADHGVRQLLGRVEADGGFRLTPRLESASFELLRRFVTAGMGVTFLPEFAVFTELRAGPFAAIRLSDPLLTAAATHLVVRVGRRLPEAANALVSWLADQLICLSPRDGTPR